MSEKEKEISERLNSTIDGNNNVDKYSFNYGMKQTFSNIIDKEISPWLVKCFTKYTPQQFHTIMSENYYNFDDYTYRGFDFIGDWRKHHKRIFTAFKLARKMQKYIVLDIDKIYNTIVNLLDENGYNLQDYEKQCIQYTIIKVYRLIYY